MAQEDVPIAFFSYCREDSEFALKLAADLKVAGAHVWIDQLDIEPGTPWDRAVEDALTSSPRMLVILSPVSVNSDNVRDEVSFALSRQKRVIPVLYRDCDVPFRLARLQHIDFRPDYVRALAILLRALGVGEAAHAHASSGAVIAVAAEIEVTSIEIEERTRQQKLDEERRLADEQAQLEEARKYAEQSRLKKEREAAAAEAARQQQEQQRNESEGIAHQERSRREQRAAEQARLEEEARVAAERVRLAQQEKERREAEIKARQEQLRREEQESIERKSLALDSDAPAKQASHPVKPIPIPVPLPVQQQVQPKPAAEKPRAEQASLPAPELRVPPRKQSSGEGLNLTSSKFLAGGAAVIVALAVIIFLLAHRSGPDKSPAGESTESKAAQAVPAQPQPQTPAERPSESASSPSQQPAPTATMPKQDQPKDKAPPATGRDVANLAKPANATSAADSRGSANRVRVSQGVSHAMLMYEVAPAYPPLARSARVQGQVVLDVVIGKDGSVQEIAAEPGANPLLVPSAIDAVKKWRYKPYKLDGKPVDVDTQVIVNFTLTN